MAVSAAQAAALLGRALVELGNNRRGDRLDRVRRGARRRRPEDDDHMARRARRGAGQAGRSMPRSRWLVVRSSRRSRPTRWRTRRTRRWRWRGYCRPDGRTGRSGRRRRRRGAVRGEGPRGRSGSRGRAGGGDRRHAVARSRYRRTRIERPELGEFFDRYAELWRSRDVDGLLAMCAIRRQAVDHRKLGRGECHGLEGHRRLAPRGSPHVPRPAILHRPCDRVRARRDRDEGQPPGPGLARPTASSRSRSALCLAFRDGRIRRQDLFEPVDEAAIRACFAEQRGLTLLGDKPPERWWSRFVERFREHDRAGLAEMWSPDMVLVDHRAVGWEEMHGLDSMLELADSAWAWRRTYALRSTRCSRVTNA